MYAEKCISTRVSTSVVPRLLTQKSIIICSARMRCKDNEKSPETILFGKKVVGIENNSHLCTVIIKWDTL